MGRNLSFYSFILNLIFGIIYTLGELTWKSKALQGIPAFLMCLDNNIIMVQNHAKKEKQFDP